MSYNNENAQDPAVENNFTTELVVGTAAEPDDVQEIVAVPVIVPEPDMTTAVDPALMYAGGGEVGSLGATLGPIGTLENNGQQAQVGQFHPAHSLLDQIDTMVSFASDEVNHTVRDLVKKVRAML